MVEHAAQFLNLIRVACLQHKLGIRELTSTKLQGWHKRQTGLAGFNVIDGWQQAREHFRYLPGDSDEVSFWGCYGPLVGNYTIPSKSYPFPYLMRHVSHTTGDAAQPLAAALTSGEPDKVASDSNPRQPNIAQLRNTP